MLFVENPRPLRRSPAFVISGALHAVLVVVMALWTVGVPKNERRIKPTYSVRLLQLQIPRRSRAAVAPGASRTGSAALWGSSQRGANRDSGSASASGKSGRALLAVAAPSSEPVHRRFKLPSDTRLHVGKHTLVQLDVPPDIVLKQDIPLPTVLLWNQTEAPAMRRRFVAPPVKQLPKVMQSLPTAPALEAPNRETTVAELNLAASILNDTPRLVHPPSVASPVASAGQEKAKEIPQIGLAASNEPTSANLISLPDNPAHSLGVVALPPANEIAPGAGGAASGVAGAGSGGAGKDGAGQGAGENGLGSGASAGAGAGSGASGSGAMGSGAGSGGRSGGPGSGNGSAGYGNGSSASGNGSGGTGATGNGRGNGNGGPGLDGSGTGLGYDTTGLTRINLPKEGKFGVIVLGSADSSRYPESVGALSGKVVYTVYLKVGLRKNWIMQYCLPRAGQKNVTTKGTATRIDAPWPFLIMRPDRWSDSDPDYIMIHGLLTEAGQFDQLAMVFPEELEKKEWLLHSLKLWAFRPASRDGEPVGVEVLLIIPKQSE